VFNRASKKEFNNNAEKPLKERQPESSPLCAPSEKIGYDVCGKSEGIAFRWRFLATNAAQKWRRKDELEGAGYIKQKTSLVSPLRGFQTLGGIYPKSL